MRVFKSYLSFVGCNYRILILVPVSSLSHFPSQICGKLHSPMSIGFVQLFRPNFVWPSSVSVTGGDFLPFLRLHSWKARILIQVTITSQNKMLLKYFVIIDWNSFQVQIEWYSKLNFSSSLAIASHWCMTFKGGYVSTKQAQPFLQWTATNNSFNPSYCLWVNTFEGQHYRCVCTHYFASYQRQQRKKN